MSEDCLKINVQRPAGTRSGSKLPVMAWIHGGAFHSGTSSSPWFNATELISQSVSRGTPIIYVNFNSRQVGAKLKISASKISCWLWIGFKSTSRASEATNPK
ncbi:hypothetical protein HGRIS_005155 [Hohenbuehelia grisea]|uniref:Carboxylesterase type B domain-containing protein n=1 Tax=Hohenbuehelia grisea TaxID=104357 RepID=A0ABR3JF04_9AGAR